MDHIGKICSYCKRHDFLPFQCKYCHDYFCIRHRSPSYHDCAFIPNNTVSNKKPSSRQTYECLFCSKKGYLQFHCPVCNENFCVSHRHAEDHKCTKAFKRKKSSSLFDKICRYFKNILNFKKKK